MEELCKATSPSVNAIHSHAYTHLNTQLGAVWSVPRKSTKGQWCCPVCSCLSQKNKVAELNLEKEKKKLFRQLRPACFTSLNFPMVLCLYFMYSNDCLSNVEVCQKTHLYLCTFFSNFTVICNLSGACSCIISYLQLTEPSDINSV